MLVRLTDLLALFNRVTTPFLPRGGTVVGSAFLGALQEIQTELQALLGGASGFTSLPTLPNGVFSSDSIVA